MHTALGRFRPFRILVAAFAAIALLASGARAAFADQTVHVKHASLDNWQGQCLDSGGKITLWHFVITQIGSDAPSSITVYWGPGVSETVPLDKITGDTAQYDTSLHAGTLVSDATAIVPDAWTGQFNLSHVECAPGDDPPSSVVTEVHLGATDGTTPVVVTNVAPAPLGSTVHDSARLDTDPTGVTLPTGSNLGFSFWASNDCTGDVVEVQNFDVGGQTTLVTVDPALAQGPLGAGGYSYRADFTSGDEAAVTSSGGACEPFTVSKADTTTTTNVYNTAGTEITNGAVPAGTYVHDHAVVGPEVTGFPITGAVTYSLYASGRCTGTKAIADETVAVGTDSTPVQITTPGYYGYLVTYSGDANYNGSTGVCEPFAVYQNGLTMGFWGNTNGVARITAAGGYAANAVTIGRGAVIDTQAESLKVLPNTLNACGKGSPVIFSDQTSSKDCSLAIGINKSSLNALAAQTLALGYNIKLVGNYAGQTIGLLQCGAYLPVNGLTSASTVQDSFNAAVALINGSAVGGTTTQTQVGAMNALLGCLNREV